MAMGYVHRSTGTSVMDYETQKRAAAYAGHSGHPLAETAQGGENPSSDEAIVHLVARVRTA
jgi:hypothetical protein